MEQLSFAAVTETSQDYVIRTVSRFRKKEREEDKILQKASEILARRTRNSGVSLSNPCESKALCTHLVGGRDQELFGVLWLNSQNQLIKQEILFYGTIDGASIFPRIVVKRALEVAAARLVITHNHPSGSVTPSSADLAITNRLRDVLAMIDVDLLDHIIVGSTAVSLAELGHL